MAWIIETPNPFEPLSSIKSQVDGGTIRNWVSLRYPGTEEFPIPTICLLNGKPLLRRDWHYEMRDGDVINFLAVQGWTLVIAIIVAIVVSILVAVLMPVPKLPNDALASDPVFSIKGQGNLIRLGEPIECCYGRNRIYPAFAARPYYEYQNNDQFQFSLLCLGHGHFDVDAVQIGDTPIANFEEVSYEVIPPGGTVTLFPANVYTSPEAGGQTLFAPNQPEYSAPGWTGPFSANPSGSLATQLQVDIIFPKGVYWMGKRGEIFPLTVSVEVQKRLIDDAGTPLGAWEQFNSELYFAVEGATTAPQRRTYSSIVPAGRYEVQIRRVSNYSYITSAGEDVIWEGLRGWLTREHDYGNVTLLAVKIRATNNLNDRTSQRFNVVATRKLPIRESSGVYSAPTATRSIVWAFVDIFRSVYGGRITEDTFFDWDSLEALDTLYTSRGEHFDWVFRDPSTVWDSAKIVAMAGRGIPLLIGSMITLKRDTALSVPVTLFNRENIVSGSFEWAIKLWDLDEFDSIRVEYTDPDTGYQQETVVAVLPGGTADHPQDLRLLGVQDRTHAYRAGLYTMAATRYLRENITFETGMEGYLPTYGDLIAVAHDVPKWGQGGYLVNAIRGAGITYHLWLSEPLSFDDSVEYQIALRGRHAEIIGPFIARQTQDPKQVIIESADTLDFMLTGKTEPMLFLFGVIDEVINLMKVVRVEPTSGDRIQITAVKDNPIIHSFDALTPPAIGETPHAPIPPDLPEITQIFVAPINGPLLSVQVSWTAAFGAQSYLVQSSEDGTNWTDRGRIPRTSLQMSVRIGDLYVRAAAINNGQGPWIQSHVVIGPLNALFLEIPWDDVQWKVSWSQVLNMVGWVIRVYDTSGSDPILQRTDTLEISDAREFTYNYAKALIDGNLVREMRVEVDVLFAIDDGSGREPSGSPVSLEFSNTIPAAPTGLSSAVQALDSDGVVHRFHWMVPVEEDLIRMKLWVSPINGFDPLLVLPVIDQTAGAPGSAGQPTFVDYKIDIDSLGDHGVYYWRVAFFDVWGNEISTNVSAQQTIPAYT